MPSILALLLRLPSATRRTTRTTSPARLQVALGVRTVLAIIVELAVRELQAPRSSAG